MTPYYQEDGITLYCGDCMDILPQFKDKEFDLVLTDPPYNVGIDYGNMTNDNKTNQEFIQWICPRFIEMRRVANTILISTGHIRLADYAKIENWKWLLAWWKPAAMGRSPVGFSNWEPIAMYGKGGNTSVDFIRAPIVPDSQIDFHPCPKPLEWARKLITIIPNVETILDPFCGSCTTLVAAKQLGRKAVGIEISEKYCEIAVKRLAQMQLEFT